MQDDIQKPSSGIGLLLTVTLMISGALLSLQFLVNPLALPWLKSKEAAPVLTELAPPQTLKQIATEITESRLRLGEKLNISSRGLNIYPLIDIDTKAIRQIRIYQIVDEGFWQDEKQKKLRLLKQLDVVGVEEGFAKAPSQKYVEPSKPNNSKNILPLKELHLIPGDAPTQGTWFVATGKIGGVVYGQVFSDVSNRAITMELEWTNLNSRLPYWQRFSTVKNPEPDLIIDQTQNFDPLFLVFRLDAAPNRVLQFRQINLHESPAMPKIYSQALVLASSGLWTSALAKFDKLKSEIPTLEPLIQEQYDLISFHAKITADQAQNPSGDYGKNALILGINGSWDEALKNLKGSDFAAKIVLEMLKTNSAHLWQRVNTALEIEPSPEAVIWGSVIVMQRQDFPAAERWLRAHWQFSKLDISEAINVLQRLDLSPLGIKPEQFVGSVRFIGTSRDNKWQITPPPLPEGQAWYEVDISVIRDQDVWRNAPFPGLEARSRLIIWKALGLEISNILAVEIPHRDGETISLIAQSLWVGNDGQIKLLASGSPELSKSLDNGLALIKGGSFFIESRGTYTSGSSIDLEVADQISHAIYAELSAFGNVSVSSEEFRQKFVGWDLEQANLQGPNSQDLILKIDRDKIDLGERNYPIVMIFSKNGNLLFSDMSPSAPRKWVTLLPGTVPQKILVQSYGNYESWSLVP